ncbi:zinc-RING finger domain-containing protein [Hirsutella rhossiliensis]|uniref:Zinc-RING finger domain-containing protein n=1 Tax=Hirsutella rhossiliensis TaxID=111463 RepID=A0A9P8SNJ7_9HYPO|nr:zinc-RING finger domain-containing protein [Hirsutella rhossiliensis]KAH0967955.1 zinc-RING finger domain-containing protein [Hirsutella rhossiliensis]
MSIMPFTGHNVAGHRVYRTTKYCAVCREKPADKRPKSQTVYFSPCGHFVCETCFGRDPTKCFVCVQCSTYVARATEGLASECKHQIPMARLPAYILRANRAETEVEGLATNFFLDPLEKMPSKCARCIALGILQEIMAEVRASGLPNSERAFVCLGHGLDAINAREFPALGLHELDVIINAPELEALAEKKRRKLRNTMRNVYKEPGWSHGLVEAKFVFRLCQITS